MPILIDPESEHNMVCPFILKVTGEIVQTEVNNELFKLISVFFANIAPSLQMPKALVLNRKCGKKILLLVIEVSVGQLKADPLQTVPS